MFVVFRFEEFNFEITPEHSSPPPPILLEKGRMVGFLPVYETREDALADYPDAELREIRLV